MDSRGKIIIAIFMVIFAFALTGKTTIEVGIHPDCQDSIDNDADFDIDWYDYECFIYPFADGGGEYETTSGAGGKAWSSDAYSQSIWEIHYQYTGFYSDPDWCLNYPTWIGNYQQFEIDSAGKDTSAQDFTTWKNTFCPP